LVCDCCRRRANCWAWIFGLVGVCLYCWDFAQAANIRYSAVADFVEMCRDADLTDLI
jgi:hypothetical protein